MMEGDGEGWAGLDEATRVCWFEFWSNHLLNIT